MPRFQSRDTVYQRYWSLHSSPFLQQDWNHFYSGTLQREATARIGAFIGGKRRFGVLQAEPGCGVTRLFQHLSLRVGFGDCAVQMVMTSGKATCNESLDREFASSWLGREARVARRGRGVESFFAENDAAVRIVWLIDRCSPFVACRAFELAKAHTHLRVIAATDSRSRRSSSWPRDEGQRLMKLDKMSFDDAVDYASKAVRTSGSVRPIFTTPALRHLHELSGGRIRDFSVLAEQALRIGFENRSSMVNSGEIELAAQSLSWDGCRAA